MKKQNILKKSCLFIFLILYFPSAAQTETTEVKAAEWQFKGAICALQNPSENVEAEALRKLIDLDLMQKFPPEKIGRLIILLDSNDPEVRATAVNALKAMGESAAVQEPQVVVRVIEMLSDDNDAVRQAAVPAIGEMKVSVAADASKIGNLLDNKRPEVRLAALQALQALGKAAYEQIPLIEKRLADEDPEVQEAASATLDILRYTDTSSLEYTPVPINDEAVTRFSAQTTDRTSEIVKGLNSQNKDVLIDAIYYLQTIGPDAAIHAPELGDLLEFPDSDVQYAALGALSKMGDAASAQFHKIARMLNNSDYMVRSEAARALGEMRGQAPYIAKLLENEDKEIVKFSLRALMHMGPAAAGQAPSIVKLLTDDDIRIRLEAIETLKVMPKAIVEYLPAIAKLLDHPDDDVRIAALETLEEMGIEVPHVIQEKIEPLLDHKDWRTRQKALGTLRAMGVSSHSLRRKTVIMLSDYDQDVRQAAVEFLERIGYQKDIGDTLLILNGLYKIPTITDALTFYAYYFGGGDKDKNTLIEWLTTDSGHPRSTVEGSKLKLFLDAMSTEGLHKEVREKLATSISWLIRTVNWQESDQDLLIEAEKKLRDGPFLDQADVVKRKINEIERNQALEVWRNRILCAIGIHVIFWIALINLYPTSLRVQSIFFWSAWSRRIFGFFYVGIILAYVPYFRAKLFAPFRTSLISNAAVETFDDDSYFDGSKVKDVAAGQTRPLKEAVKELKRQIYFEGESGLGKTMFLRYLIKHTKRTVIYLRADNCSKGVIEAIQSILHGPAQDPGFLKSLIHTGAIDIYIDGLNEVSPDTRAHITEFIQNYPKANIIIATQPLEWVPPSTLKKYVLQPLDDEQIETFLLTRKQSLPADATITGEEFELACRNYLNSVLDDKLPLDKAVSTKRVLSNPIDLTIVALMLAHGQYPDIFHLLDQQYDLMNEYYERQHNSEFPLKAFSETVYKMRLNDRNALDQNEYLKEIKAMEKHKMVQSRRLKDAQERVSTIWQFRHDKIMDYFIMCTFLGPNNIRLEKHIKDTRFRGVYFLLAILMPIEEATVLREQLIQYSAETKDHTVSDTFIQLFGARKAA